MVWAASYSCRDRRLAGKSLRDIHSTYQMVGGLSNRIALIYIVESGMRKSIDGCSIRRSRTRHPALAEKSHCDGPDDQNAHRYRRCDQCADGDLLWPMR